MQRRVAFGSLMTACISFPISAIAAQDVSALRWESNARLRAESVDDAAFDKKADAFTLRERLGMRWTPDTRFTALVEIEAIAAAGGYDSGANGRSEHPAIADAAEVELNQAWVAWQRDAWTVALGRQRLQWDNQRWIGNSGWRQNEQTFDAVSAQWAPVPEVTVRYVALARVHRVNGDEARDPRQRERQLASHALDLEFTRGISRWGAFVLAHDDRDVGTASTLTAGLRWIAAAHAADGGWGVRLDAARQRDSADNPLSFSHAYWLVEPSWTRRGVTWRLGWERLDGDGRHALQAPLATLHAFNGWADRFLVTPADGLDDRYASAGGSIDMVSVGRALNWTVAWHRYTADNGDAYGREWNASVGTTFGKGVTGQVKFADYRSDGFAADTRKVWLQLEWGF